MQLKTYGTKFLIERFNDLFKNVCTGSVTIMEVAAICDYLCDDGGEISAPVADRTPTVRLVMSLY